MEITTITDVNDLNSHYNSPYMEAKRNGITYNYIL